MTNGRLATEAGGVIDGETVGGYEVRVYKLRLGIQMEIRIEII